MKRSGTIGKSASVSQERSFRANVRHEHGIRVVKLVRCRGRNIFDKFASSLAKNNWHLRNVSRRRGTPLILRNHLFLDDRMHGETRLHLFLRERY